MCLNPNQSKKSVRDPAIAKFHTLSDSSTALILHVRGRTSATHRRGFSYFICGQKRTIRLKGQWLSYMNVNAEGDAVEVYLGDQDRVLYAALNVFGGVMNLTPTAQLVRKRHLQLQDTP